MRTPPYLPLLLSAADLAAALGISICTLYKLTNGGTVPRPLKLNHRRYWCRDDVANLPGFGVDHGDEVNEPWLASLLGLSVPAVYGFVRSGHIPQPTKRGHSSTWSVRDVIAHLKRLPH